MSEILKLWLGSRLGLIVDYNLTSFADIAQDGTLLAEVLENYGIISSENLQLLKKTYDIEEAYANQEYLKSWLQSIGINIDEKVMREIANKNEMAAIRLFYQLYVILNSKNKLSYLVDRKMNEELCATSDPKSLDKLYNACEINQISCAPNIQNTIEVIKWHKDKYLDLLKRSSIIRTDYVKFLEEKIRLHEEQRLKDYREKYMDEIEFRKKNQIMEIKSEVKPLATCKVVIPDTSLSRDATGHCEPDKKKARQFIKYLRIKERFWLTKKNMQNHICKLLLSSLYDKIVEKEDDDFKALITSKLLRQSEYEKQITLKLVEVRFLKEAMLTNLQNQNRLYIKVKENDFLNRLYQQHLNVSFKEQRYIDNRKRQLELHRRLWNAKLEREHQDSVQMCEDIVYDLIDSAIKRSEYIREYGMEPSQEVQREWNLLFFNELPILDIIKDPSEILSEISLFDNILTLELYRQIGLDEADFSDYNNLYALWNNENALTFFEENRPEIQAGLNILGFIVHRLLKIKYPYPDPPERPELPPTDVRAALTGMVNHEVLPLLQKFLVRKEVLVLEIQNVINYFLTIYAEESTIEYDDRLNTETEKSKKKGKPGKEKKEKKDKKGDKKDKKKDKGSDKKSKKKGGKLPAEIPTELVPKETQTPRYYPGEEIELSWKGELGKMAYETLNIGLQLNEYLLIHMLIEYFQNIPPFKGWVLINFPETLNEAYMLEEFFNGKVVPENFRPDQSDLEEQYELESVEDRDAIFDLPPDPHVDIRLSQLLPNPKPSPPNKYESFLTSFIHINSEPEGTPEEYETEYFTNDLTTFYDRLTVNNSFTYHEMDNMTLSEIVKFVTRDEAYAKQIYDELVESSELTALTARKKRAEEKEAAKGKGKKGKDKKGKEKKEKKGKSDASSEKTQKSKKGKKGKEPIEVEVRPPTPPPIFEEVYVEPPKPGEQDWGYITLPLTKELCVLLGTNWQEGESIYLNDFKELFFSKRLYQDEIIPYIHGIDTHMQQYIERPDNKQEYLTEFQTIYNAIESDLREDNEYKAELHFRLKQFRDKLWDICDTRQRESEEERQKIIKENWFATNSSLLTNVYLKAAQLEMNRCILTLQFLQDYYTSMTFKKPTETKSLKFALQQIDVVPVFDLEERSDTYYVKAVHILANKLINVSESTQENPYTTYLLNAFNTCISQLLTWRSASLGVVKSVEKHCVVKPPKSGKKEKKAIKPKKKKVEVTLTEFDILLAQKAEDMIREWICAIEGEILRTKFRLTLIHERGQDNINDNLTYAENLFYDVHDRIQERFLDEVESVDCVCLVFARAIEATQPIQLRLVIKDAQFRIEQNMLFYSDEPFKYPTLRERESDIEFTIFQLDMLVSIFLDLSPNGCIPVQTFIYILQDLVCHKPEQCAANQLPEKWYNLNLKQVVMVVKQLYGDPECIDWKDFIIWNLLLPFPTEYELLDVRRQFRNMDPDKLEYVNKQQYFSVQFWFEEEFYGEQDYLRMNLIKELLFRMFQVQKDHVNYTGLLLYFCKDMDSLHGVSKALELAMGNLVCWDTEIGNKFATLLRIQKEIEAKEREQMLACVNSVIERVFDRTCKHFESSTSFLDADYNEYYGIKDIPVHGEYSHIFEESLGEEEELGATGELPNLIYFLPFSALLKVIVAVFPWHSSVPYMCDLSLRTQLEIIYDSCRNEYFDNKVFMHVFLNDQRFLDLLDYTSKFVERCPSEAVRNFIEICTCEPIINL